MTMIAVTSSASEAPITCSRLRWRMKAARSRKAARGLDGRGNHDIGKEDRTGEGLPPVRSMSGVELEAKADHDRRRDRLPVLHRRLVAPVRHQVPARRGEEDRVRAPDGIDSDDAALLIDRKAKLQRRLFLGEQLR